MSKEIKLGKKLSDIPFDKINIGMMVAHRFNDGNITAVVVAVKEVKSVLRYRHRYSGHNCTVSFSEKQICLNIDDGPFLVVNNAAASVSGYEAFAEWNYIEQK